MSSIRLAGRQGTVLWDGDVVVLGAGLAGLSAALGFAREGKKICIVEPGPTLGRELSAEWQLDLPPCGVVSQVTELAAQHGGGSGPVDIVLGTLAFDRVIEAAGVTAIVKVVPVRPVTDADGLLQGVEVVGKSGRQLVRAPVVVDATPGRPFSRAAVGWPRPHALAAERRVYLQGVTAPTAGAEFPVPATLGVEGDVVRLTPAAWEGEAVLSFRTGADEREPGELGQATLETAVLMFTHLRLHTPAFADATLVDIAPECRIEFAAETAIAGELARTGIQVLPTGESPSEEIEAAQRLASAPAAGDRTPVPSPASDTGLDVMESAELSTTPDQDLLTVELPEIVAQLHEPRDIVVAGYGTGGAFAALAAAEHDVEVTVLDPAPLPGGIATAGRIHSYYHGIKGGIQDRLDEATAGHGSDLAVGVRGFHPVGKAHVLVSAIKQAGIEVRGGHTVFGVIKNGSRIEGIVSAAADGYHVFPCLVAVDGTGDGDVAAAAGARVRLGRAGDGFPQPYSYTPSLIRNSALGHHNFDAGWVDPTDTLDFSRAHFEGRDRIWLRGPFSPERHYCTLASVLGLRESRFIEGLATPTFEDFLNGRTYAETVCDAYAHYDNHAMDYAEESDWGRRHVVLFGMWRTLCRGEVPFGALVPNGVDGLLVACRALSVDHDLHQLLRMQRDMQKIGEVCGHAAAMCAQAGAVPAALDVAALREQLGRRGILPDTPAEAMLDVPVTGLLNALGGDENGLAMWRISRLPESERGPVLELVRQGDDANKRFCAAVALAVAGCRDEAVLDVLRQTVGSRTDDEPLGIKSPPRHVVAALALAEHGAAGSAELVGEILLTDPLEAPTQLLLIKALESAGDPAGVPVLREFLAKTEGVASEVPMWGCGEELKTSFRFALELRAVRTLVALGCKDECGRLDAYLNDPHLLTRRYARQIAREAEAIA